MNSDGYPIGSAFPDGVTSDALVSLDDTASIELGDNSISFNATTVEINGVPIVDIGNVFNPMLSELDCNNFSLTDANEVTASKFIIKDGPVIPGYLLSDGSIVTNSGDGVNSNIYLYNNNLTITSPPAAGQIRYNNAVIPAATEIYISHLTRDNVDIDVFLALISQLSIIYIQDQDSSINYIRYNVTAPPVLTPNAFITIPVTVLDTSGTGATNFPAGMNLFMSIFTNDVEIDTRLTAVEGKTQNINATASQNVFEKTTLFVLNPAASESFAISNNSFPFSTTKFSVSNTSVQIISVPLLMNTQRITLLGAPIDNNDAARKVYVDDADALKLNLTGGNITGNLTVAGNLVTRLGAFDVFNITNNTGSAARFTLSNTNATSYVTMSMNNNILNGIPTPVSNDDATNKAYVDTRDALQLNLTGGTLTGNLTAPSFIKTGGLITQFLKANGDSDASIYLKADGTVSMTGALNMGNQNITTAGSITGTSIIKTGGTATQYLLANGTVDSRSMSTAQVIQVDNLTSAGVSEFNMTQVATVGSWSWADAAIGYTRQVTIRGTLSRSANTATTWSLRIKTNGTENTIYAFPASPNTIVTGVPWVMYITWTRYLAGALMWNIRWESVEATTAGYWTTRTQNATGFVVALGVSAAYTITMQSNVATSSLNVIHANVQNIYTG